MVQKDLGLKRRIHIWKEGEKETYYSYKRRKIQDRKKELGATIFDVE